MTARKRKPKPASLSSRPEPTILKVEPDTTLRVQLVESPKVIVPTRKWLRILVRGLVLAALFYGFLMARYVLPRHYVPPKNFNGIPELFIGLSYPAYLAFGDIGEIVMTISNRGDTAISGTLVFAFTEKTPVHIMPSKSTAITLTELKHGESLTERLSILLNRSLWLREEAVSFQMLAEVKSRRGILPDSLAIHTAPIPYLSTIFAWLPTGSILLSGLLAFLWEALIKQRLAPKQD
jgi:hypothetical protein